MRGDLQQDAENDRGRETRSQMLTFLWIGALFILVLVAIFAYSSRNKKQQRPPDAQTLTATDAMRNPDRKRATGAGED